MRQDLKQNKSYYISLLRQIHRFRYINLNIQIAKAYMRNEIFLHQIRSLRQNITIVLFRTDGISFETYGTQNKKN